jgi:predicted AlkP superfamily phosphohydrolase/phosphomutase
VLPPPAAPVDPDEVRTFGETIRKYYEYTDGIVGEFLDLAGDGWTVIVTSDHGHSGPKLRGTTYAIGTAMHDPTGVVVLSGKDIVARRKLSGARVLDLTPTILTLFGLPVATDMDGRPLTGAIDPGFLKKHPIQWVETYEVGEGQAERAEQPADSKVQEQAQKHLRSYGYGY